MWHGTKGNPSSLITEGEEGFDMRFARNGAEGSGNYFAYSSSYSAGGYKTNVGNGTFEVFYAHVLKGDSAPHVDGSRNKPPIKSGNIRFDSVDSPGTMLIVYSNLKAYPMYLVNFQ